MTETDVDPLRSNQLFAEAKAATIPDVVRSLDKEERKETKKEIHDVDIEESINKSYNEYIEAYIEFFGNDSYEISMKDKDGIVIPAKIWGSKKSQIQRKISKFGTYQNQVELEEKEKISKSKAKKGKKG